MFDNENENSKINLIKRTVTLDNVKSLFEAAQIPLHFDYFSLDINFMDYWMLKKVLEAGYRPRAVVVEVDVSDTIQRLCITLFIDKTISTYFMHFRLT
jgi:hypothetical protein